jgi:hypothetical protein
MSFFAPSLSPPLMHPFGRFLPIHQAMTGNSRLKSKSRGTEQVFAFLETRNR